MAAAVFAVAALALPAGAAASADPNIHWESYLPDFPPTNGPQPHAVPGCRQPTIGCIDREIRHMTRVQQRYGCDHRAVFDTTYLVLTKTLRQTVVDQPHLFSDPKYLFYEDALFASIYFNTLKSWSGGRPVAPAWRIALETARSGQVNAAQDMLLGINAHVQNDMPFVVAALGVTKPDGSSRKPDHDIVNNVLNDAYEPVVDEIARRYDPFVSLSNAKWDPLDDIAGIEMVRGWREEVWRNAERLIEAKDDAARAQVASQIQANAEAWAETIAAPQQPGYRAQRDAYCAKALAAGA